MNSNKPNQYSSLFSCNGEMSGKRAQTVLTPAAVLDPVRAFFGGEIGYDPTPAAGSLVRPESGARVPWAALWDRAAELAYLDQPKGSPIPQLIWACLRCEIAQKDLPDALRATVINRSRAIKDQIYKEFSQYSGSMRRWHPRTFCNPPFGDRGPETILGDFESFCAAFARAEYDHGTIFLGPVRSHRKWWCRDILARADVVIFLTPVKFEGFKYSFPAPLALAYKGPHSRRAVEYFGHLGHPFSVDDLRD